MDKVRLDFYLGLGVKLVKGDECLLHDYNEITFISSNEKHPFHGEMIFLLSDDGHRGLFNKKQQKDIAITSFTDRENKGVQPVPDGFPVVVKWSNGEVGNSVAREHGWVIDEYESVVSWKPNYDKLLEMQKEHDTKQEGIEYCKQFDEALPIEELMINAKESKMSKNNKHPHHDLIVEWAKDTSKELVMITKGIETVRVRIDNVTTDIEGDYDFGLKPREFQKGHWYPCKTEDDVKVRMWTGSKFVLGINSASIFNAEDFLEIGKSLGEIKFGGEE